MNNVGINSQGFITATIVTMVANWKKNCEIENNKAAVEASVEV
jgi:hypothetical protein